jgi:hypothetical protein
MQQCRSACDVLLVESRGWHQERMAQSTRLNIANIAERVLVLVSLHFYARREL